VFLLTNGCESGQKSHLVASNVELSIGSVVEEVKEDETIQQQEDVEMMGVDQNFQAIIENQGGSLQPSCLYLVLVFNVLQILFNLRCFFIEFIPVVSFQNPL
jgi:hypothetical protein